MKLYIAIALASVVLSGGCVSQNYDDSAYVLIRYSTANESRPSLRAYFTDEGAQINGISCKEVLQLVNEAVDARVARGETNLVKYQCVSLEDARERGFKQK